MRIASSEIAMGALSRSVTVETREESLRIQAGGREPAAGGPPGAVVANISALARAIAEAARSAESTREIVFEPSLEDRMKALLVEILIEAITGSKVKIRLPEKLEVCRGRGQVPAEAAGRRDWGIEYNVQTTRYEHQQVKFIARGTVTTADGRQIDISIDMNMEREFFSRESLSVSFGEGARIDPLILNLDGGVVQLTEARFEFDLSADGNLESIPFAGEGNGFLALDLNGDGVINDGRELFGPSTGNGFAELARYDEDGNGWIDEGDSVYSNLLIWTRDASGNDRLHTLREAGVGAIYLGNARVAFDMKDSANRTMGEARSAGLYLRESGTTGSIMQVDMVT